MTNEMFRAIRLYKNMSQREFSEWLGVSLAVIARIESGDIQVSERVRGKLAHKFHVDDDFLNYYENYRTLSQV